MAWRREKRNETKEQGGSPDGHGNGGHHTRTDAMPALIAGGKACPIAGLQRV